ncbi:MAG TPA: hypothetical protein VGK76_04530 [Candidatus Eisenbacteria bacterium]|jgi:hypothetical protein
MQYPSSTAKVRKGTAFLPAFALTFLLTATTPGIGSGEDGASIRGLVHEFNSICADLQTARCDLQMGTVDQSAFGDWILDLFVRADSITTLLDRFAPAPRPIIGPAFALEWALRYLRESLRENYEGIVEGNGYRFVTADLALKAAEAWRGNLVQPTFSLR